MAKKLALATVLAVFAASWIQPLWPLEQTLHSSLMRSAPCPARW
jgi:putative membrane protein